MDTLQGASLVDPLKTVYSLFEKVYYWIKSILLEFLFLICLFVSVFSKSKNLVSIDNQD